MNAPFRRALGRVTIVHGIAVILIIFGQLIFSQAPKIRPKDLVFVDLSGGGGPAGPPDVTPVKEIKPPEIKQPLPPPDQPRVKDIAEVKQPIKPKPKIERSTNLVVRAEKPKQPPAIKPKAMSAEEIKKMLAQGLKPMPKGASTSWRGGGAPGSGSGPGSDSPVAWYYAMVRQLMYEAWEQPGELAVPGNPVAEVTLTVQRDGSITARKLTQPSGNDLMDKSVQKAVNSVSRLRPLPPQFIGPSRDIVVLFELTRGGL